MRAVVIQEATRKLGAPSGHDGEVTGLHIREEQLGRMVFMISAWEPTPDELASLAAGGKVWLWVSAPQHPVVALSVAPADPL